MDKCDVCKGGLIFHHKSLPRVSRDNKRKQTVWYECINCGQRISEEVVVGWSNE